MKIQLDTVKKTIILENDVNLDEFFKRIRIMLPNDLWKKFTLRKDYINKFDWIDPIIVPYPIPVPIWPPYTPPYPWITWGDHTGTPLPEIPTITCSNGIFNIEME